MAAANGDDELWLPEDSIAKYEKGFQAWHSKLLLLKSNARDDEEDTGSEGNKTEDNSFIEAACMHVLRQKLLKNVVAGRHLANIIENPPDPQSSSPIMCHIYNKIKDLLRLSAQLSVELDRRQKELEEVHVDYFRAQTECQKTKIKFMEQLKTHKDEKQRLDSKKFDQKIVKSKSNLNRKLTRCNFIRTVLVLLISHSDVNLLENRDFVQILMDYAMPLTIQDIYKAVTPRESQGN